MLVKHAHLLAALFLATGNHAHAQLDIVINAGPDLLNNSQALAAFERAAAQWETFFTDPITVNIDADLDPNLPESTLGQASSVLLTAGYDTLRNSVVTDAAAETDDAIVAFLPDSANFGATLPAGVSLVTANLAGNKANLKALGFENLDAAFGPTDATITFNSTFNFDFDNSDGITSGSFDFESVASHEIGHALGFTSAVDQVDALVSSGSTGAVNPTIFDLFRFSDTVNPSTTTEFTNFDRNLVPGETSHFDEVIENFIPGSEGLLATGVTQGDGDQASHWKDLGSSATPIGILDPNLAADEIGVITIADIRALDLIGYDINITTLVPEPSSTLLLTLSFCLMGSRRRRF